MEPEVPGATTRATLVDVLDRLLEKGLVIRADLMISLAGIPLIGVSLHAAVAGMETMLEYGMMTDWDISTRAFEREPAAAGAPPLLADEEALLTMPAFCYHSEGIYRAWRPGTIHLTKDRLLLYNPAFGQTLLDLPLDTITSMALTSVMNRDGKEHPVLVALAGSEDTAVKLRGPDMPGLHRAIVDRLAKLGRPAGQSVALAAAVEPALSFLAPGEETTHSGKMWFQLNAGGNARPGALDWFLEDSTGPDATTWHRGTLYLTNRRLLWTNDFDGQASFDMPLERIASCAAETRNLSKMLKRKRIVDIVYAANGSKAVASFAGNEALEWEKGISCVLSEGTAAGSVPERARARSVSHAPPFPPRYERPRRTREDRTMATGVTAMHVQAVKAVKTLEQAKIAPILREGVSRRRLCLEGRMCVDEQPCKAAVARRIGLSTKYADKRLREFAGRLFGTQEAVIRHRPPTHSPPPSPALAREEPTCRS